jgi:hypothetical protein
MKQEWTRRIADGRQIMYSYQHPVPTMHILTAQPDGSVVMTMIQEGAIQLRMKYMDDLAAFESILNPLHHAANKLTALVKHAC